MTTRGNLYRLGMAVVGGDDVREFPGVSLVATQKILAELRKTGADVTGTNPWDVDTHNHGIKLRGDHSHADVLTVRVTDKPFFVSNDRIFDEISPLVSKVAAQSPSGFAPPPTSPNSKTQVAVRNSPAIPLVLGGLGLGALLLLTRSA